MDDAGGSRGEDYRATAGASIRQRNIGQRNIGQRNIGQRNKCAWIVIWGGLTKGAKLASAPIDLAIFCQSRYDARMSTMNISLPDEMKRFVDARITSDGYGTSSEYIRELIRRDRERLQFRQYLQEGMNAKPAGRMDSAYFASLRKRAPAGLNKKAR